ncbi:MAG: hypothetical protein JWQ66_503 [Mucilaginibacter sp.]|nr:hypothetical protein [Mucilaginibacter sp.]
MDLAVYISELLGLQGEVSVPGIGYFTQVRVNGYFNEAENKFYPPAHEVSFEPHSRNEEELAKYIANKKNISMASARYFIDKYVAGLQLQLLSKKVEIAGVGYIQTSGSVLEFRADNTSKTNDPSFYGFQPVNINQPEENPVVNYVPPAKEEAPVKEEAKAEEELPVKEEIKATEEVPEEVSVKEEIKAAEEVPEEHFTTIIPPEIVPAEETPAEETQEYIDDEPERSGNRNTWIALLLVVIIALLALLGLYKYKPDWFDRNKQTSETFVAANADTVKKADGTDTTKSAIKPDSGQTVVTPQQTINAPVDTFATIHYDILGGAFKTLSQANGVIKSYKKLGLNPRILKHAKGNYYKITLGTYFNKDEAQKVEDSILTATKIDKKDIYLQPYLPKK